MISKKNRMFVMLILAGCLCFSGCQEKNNAKEKSADVPEEDYFSEVNGEGGQTVDAKFSFGVHTYDDEKAKIDYSGGELKIEFEVVPDDCSFDCSVLIYVDGIVQKYALKSKGELREQHTVKIDNKTTIISAYLNPQIDTNKKKHRVHFLCMYEPNFKPKSVQQNYGNCYRVSQVLPWELVLKGKCKKAVDKIGTGECSKITKKIRKKYLQGDANDEVEKRTLFSIEQGKKAGEIQVCILGGETAMYRLSAYVDNKLVCFSNGAQYVDVSLSKEHMYKGTVSVGKENKEKNGTFYLIAVPTSNLGRAMVQESSPVCLSEGEVYNGSDS